jgi:hypothetical protein
VHHVLGGVVHPQEQAVLLPPHPDGLAVHPEEAAPGRGGQSRGDGERGTGRRSGGKHPAIQGGPPEWASETLCQETGKHPVGGEPLDVGADSFGPDISGEASPRAGGSPAQGEAPLTPPAPEPLQRLKGPSQPARSPRGQPVALGVQSPATRAPGTSFLPSGSSYPVVSPLTSRNPNPRQGFPPIPATLKWTLPKSARYYRRRSRP